MSYDYHLPQVFPYVIEVNQEHAREAISLLVRTSYDEKVGEEVVNFTNGSSFAITSDSLDSSLRKLWLSYWSYERIKETNLLAEYGIGKEA